MFSVTIQGNFKTLLTFTVQYSKTLFTKFADHISTTMIKY